jgi:Fe-S cluster assembly ATP-binding protein
VLKIKNLSVETNGKEVLHNVSLQIKKGELHILLGPNASGKTTLVKSIMGLPQYKIKKGQIIFNKKNITKLKPEKRVKLGITLAFQHPPAIKGVKLSKLLEKISKTQDYNQHLPSQVSDREINVGFSGGERKISELVQAFALNPKFIMFDEVDSGIDVKKLEKIAKMIKNWLSSHNSALIITHSGSILRFLKPKMTHVMLNGKIICSSSNWKIVWKTIKRYGYEKCKECELFASRS